MVFRRYAPRHCRRRLKFHATKHFDIELEKGFRVIVEGVAFYACHGCGQRIYSDKIDCMPLRCHMCGTRFTDRPDVQPYRYPEFDPGNRNPDHPLVEPADDERIG